jgi:integrase/recombinase XerD
MKGQFRINPCMHGQSRFIVAGAINGQRIRAYFHTQAEAQAYAEERNIELKNFGLEVAAIPLALRVEALSCSQRLAPLKISLTQAVDFYLDHQDTRAKSVSVSQAWSELSSELERRVAADEISEAHLKCMTKNAIKLVAAFGPQYVCDLSSDLLSQWLTALPLSAVSRNCVRLNLSGFFTYAKRRNWITENPIAQVDSFKVHRIKAKLPGILSVEEAAALLTHAEPEILPHFAIGLFAGLRIAELGRLDWSEIDFETRLIDIKAEKAKTAQPRWIPMEDNLLEWLAPYRKTHGPVDPPAAKEYFIMRARRRAGIKDWGREKSNALRHSFCSYHLALHEDAPLTAARAGHMDTKMIFRNYNNRVKKAAAERYFGIRPAPEAQNILAIA